MCGIGGFVLLGKKRYPDVVDNFVSVMLEKLEHRGTHATGYLAVTDGGQYKLQKAACKARDFNDERRPIPGDTRMCLLHTRFATQGSSGFVENNHPVFHSGIYAIHNGHISNDDALFDDNKIDRNARVDSEVIPAMVGHYGWDAPEKAFKDFRGHYAVALVDAEKPGELILARGNNSPLWIVQTKDVLIWASTKDAIKEAWSKNFGTPPAERRFRELGEGTMLRVKDGVVTESPFECQTYTSSYSRSGYNLGSSWTGRGNSSYIRDGYDWDDEDYGTGSNIGSGRIFRDDPNWIRIGESSFRQRTDEESGPEWGVTKKYHFAYQVNGKDAQDPPIFRRYSEGKVTEYAEDELRLAPDWESFGNGYRKRDGFTYLSGGAHLAQQLWKNKEKDASRILERAAEKILSDMDPESDLPPDEMVIPCYSCGDFDNPDQMIWEGEHGYCDECVEALTTSGMTVSNI